MKQYNNKDLVVPYYTQEDVETLECLNNKGISLKTVVDYYQKELSDIMKAWEKLFWQEKSVKKKEKQQPKNIVCIRRIKNFGYSYI